MTKAGVPGSRLFPAQSHECFSGSSRKCAKLCHFWPHSKTTISCMKTLAIISILALLTVSGAAYTDQILTSDQQTQRAN